ncbi:MAG: SMP-30/gluconolactonase/LRE family protein [Actinobacteria bacterium]|nr:SMP-30/gluconolactonase/LRE family protein [Actinomycetota bacterium]
MTNSAEIIEVTTGLKFPEGPIAMADGSVILVEMFGPRVTRVRPDGSKETVAEIVGGPNGAAIGPDGALYLCNNGGCFSEVDFGGLCFPGPYDPARYIGGRIQRVDLETGAVRDLYTSCDGRPLRAPNDLVFDTEGGFYFTDHGIRDLAARTSDLTGIYYATIDGTSIVEVDFPAEAPNGIGLSLDGKKIYWAETHTGRVFQRDIIAPGSLSPTMPGDTSAVLCGLPGLQLLDSLAVDGAGNVCVATLVNGGITVIAPNGDILRHIATGDLLTTNICFAADGSSTAWITLSGTGRLVKMEWPWPGRRLAHSA